MSGSTVVKPMNNEEKDCEFDTQQHAKHGSMKRNYGESDSGRQWKYAFRVAHFSDDMFRHC